MSSNQFADSFGLALQKSLSNQPNERVTNMSDTGYFYPEENYDDLVRKNTTVLVEGMLGNWTGDYLYLVQDGYKFGFLVVGFGSCEFCDVLASCESQKQVDALANNIFESIKWFDSISEVKKYLNSDDQELQWYAHDIGWPEFLEKVKNYE